MQTFFFLGPSNKLIDNNLYNSYIPIIIDHLNRGNIVGLFEGRSEWGPRALCHRSILANPSFVNMSNVLNTRLARTEFMPFAPVTLREYIVKMYLISILKIMCQICKIWSRLHASRMDT
jgi:predicted NodU family carbamoyl transferase